MAGFSGFSDKGVSAQPVAGKMGRPDHPTVSRHAPLASHPSLNPQPGTAATLRDFARAFNALH
jgi:hypothetical protein